MNLQFLDSASILITGGTGSFGKTCIRYLLDNCNPRRIAIYSRDELKQYEMQTGDFQDPRIRFFIGDVRDGARLQRAMKGVDYVIHAAALKHVPACEYNPFEAIQTNIIGGQNVVNAAIDAGVKRVIALSTDKAVDPANLYGATKLCAEKLFVQGNAYSGQGGTTFACVRYGNVVGSRGSVVPLFIKQRERGSITITDKRMTRFWITLEQGVNFVLKALEEMKGGEVFVPKIPSMKVTDLARAIAPKAKVEFTGIRPGEKLHEMLISEHESRHTVELADRFIVYPTHPWWTDTSWVRRGKTPKENFFYRSDKNDDQLSVADLQKLIRPFTV